MISTMHSVLQDVGLNPHSATAQEQHLASEFARLRVSLSHFKSALDRLVTDARELQRIATGEATT